MDLTNNRYSSQWRKDNDSQNVSISEYKEAESKGKESERRVRSVLRGGYDYQGYFYFQGKVSEPPQKIKI